MRTRRGRAEGGRPALLECPRLLGSVTLTAHSHTAFGMVHDDETGRSAERKITALLGEAPRPRRNFGSAGGVVSRGGRGRASGLTTGVLRMVLASPASGARGSAGMQEGLQEAATVGRGLL